MYIIVLFKLSVLLCDLNISVCGALQMPNIIVITEPTTSVCEEREHILILLNCYFIQCFICCDNYETKM